MRPLSGGRLLMAGTTSNSSMDLGPFHLPCIACHVHDSDVFAAILDSTGAVLNARRFGSDYWDYCSGAVTLDDDGIYLAGYFYGTMFRIDNDSLDNTGVPGYSTDAYLLKLDQNLALEWLRPAGGKGNEITRQLGRTASGDLLWGVEYAGLEASYADTTLSGVYQNAFVAQLDPDGALRWIQNFTSDTILSMRGLDSDSSGRVWTTLNFGGELKYAGQSLTSLDNWDNATIQFSGSGEPLYQLHIGGPKTQNLYQIQALPGNRLFLSGTFSSSSLSILNATIPGNTPSSIYTTYTNFFATLALPAVGTHATAAGRAARLQLWPNPAGRQSPVLVELPPGSGKASGPLLVWDAGGRLAGYFPFEPGSRRAVIPAGALAAGTYWVSCPTEKGVATAGLVVVE
ncbi:MAG: hypothetical protein IT260_10945 [Saprospiraceae bacterium]|nr:hypothetical protein [Saprospiraceae bacterium]